MPVAPTPDHALSDADLIAGFESLLSAMSPEQQPRVMAWLRARLPSLSSPASAPIKPADLNLDAVAECLSVAPLRTNLAAAAAKYLDRCYPTSGYDYLAAIPPNSLTIEGVAAFLSNAPVCPQLESAAKWYQWRCAMARMYRTEEPIGTISDRAGPITFPQPISPGILTAPAVVPTPLHIGDVLPSPFEVTCGQPRTFEQEWANAEREYILRVGKAPDVLGSCTITQTDLSAKGTSGGSNGVWMADPNPDHSPKEAWGLALGTPTTE